ncbi:hypothetical protein IE53DRAFT_381269 [Violaceomyces palustris]|uniref:Uncharacterized protein n=1 Tax=Violaceomyces palustris TaxID=1673888 RepID=A0ACD0NRU5_9BASI|nr:hypothetical protein IE53DRAFT_381269 [Violaceomyces palustris]
MTQPTTIIIDEVFIPIYVILFIGTLICGFKNGFSRSAGFFSLVLFAAIRIAANAVLVYDYHDNYKNTNLITTGYLLQGLGFSFLVTSTLSFLTAAHGDTTGTDYSAKGAPKRPWLLRILHLVSIGALILLITGYTNSDSVFSGQGGKIDSKARIGDIIFCGLTIVCIIFAFITLPKASSYGRSILYRVLLALVFMAIRIGFGTWRTYQNNFLSVNIWVKLVLQYIPEVLTVIIYITVGFIKREEYIPKYDSAYPMQEGYA